MLLSWSSYYNNLNFFQICLNKSCFLNDWFLVSKVRKQLLNCFNISAVAVRRILFTYLRLAHKNQKFTANNFDYNCSVLRILVNFDYKGYPFSAVYFNYLHLSKKRVLSLTLLHNNVLFLLNHFLMLPILESIKCRYSFAFRLFLSPHDAVYHLRSFIKLRYQYFWVLYISKFNFNYVFNNFWFSDQFYMNATFLRGICKFNTSNIVKLTLKNLSEDTFFNTGSLFTSLNSFIFNGFNISSALNIKFFRYSNQLIFLGFSRLILENIIFTSVKQFFKGRYLVISFKNILFRKVSLSFNIFGFRFKRFVGIQKPHFFIFPTIKITFLRQIKKIIKRKVLIKSFLLSQQLCFVLKNLRVFILFYNSKQFFFKLNWLLDCWLSKCIKKKCKGVEVVEIRQFYLLRSRCVVKKFITTLPNRSQTPSKSLYHANYYHNKSYFAIDFYRNPFILLDRVYFKKTYFHNFLLKT